MVENFLLGVASSIVAAGIVLFITPKLSKSLKEFLIGGIARYLDVDIHSVFKNKQEATSDLKIELTRTTKAWVLTSRGNELQRDTFSPIFQGKRKDKNIDVRILLPDNELELARPDWIKQRDIEISFFDKAYGNGMLKEQIGPVIRFISQYVTNQQAQLRLYDFPHIGRIVITDHYLYLTPYSTNIHGSDNSVYKFYKGELYEAFERLFTLLWEASRSPATSRKMKVYLAGSIQKKNTSITTTWNTAREEELRGFIGDEVTLLNPAGLSASYETQTFQEDLNKIDEADAILVDVTDRRGIGVGAEMVYAKQRGKKVISIVDSGSYYMSEGQIHSFVGALSDIVVQDLRAAAQALKNMSK